MKLPYRLLFSRAENDHNPSVSMFFFLFGLLTLKTLFNMTSLQKSIKVKDCVIKRLHEELVELRGPLPDDTNSEVTGETSVAGSVGKHDKPQWSKVACSSD